MKASDKVKTVVDVLEIKIENGGEVETVIETVSSNFVGIACIKAKGIADKLNQGRTSGRFYTTSVR